MDPYILLYLLFVNIYCIIFYNTYMNIFFIIVSYTCIYLLHNNRYIKYNEIYHDNNCVYIDIYPEQNDNTKYL